MIFAMLDGLRNSLQGALKRLSGKARINPRNIDQAVQDVKFALLASDVHYDVAKELIARIKEKAMGEEVIRGVNPYQAFIKIVNDELVNILGPVDLTIPQADPTPLVIMLIGLQGSGKTTTCAKLGRYFKSNGKKVTLIAADLARPAAIDQLVTLGREHGMAVVADLPAAAQAGKESKSSVKVAQDGLQKARDAFSDVAIIDTQGRLHIDKELMGELAEMKQKIRPHLVYLVLDAMTGQDAVNSAKKFQEQVKFDAVILTKLDGDAKGGCVLSVKFASGRPIRYIGVGEDIDSLSDFYPDRMASRILGFGDIVSLVEKAQDTIKEEDAKKMRDKMLGGDFTYEDFLVQLKMIARMGNMKELVAMIPGGAKIAESDKFDENEIFRYKALIESMTKYERKNPELLHNRSRIQRISRGCGISYHEAERLVKGFNEMKHMMVKLKKGPGAMQKLLGKFMRQ